MSNSSAQCCGCAVGPILYTYFIISGDKPTRPLSCVVGWKQFFSRRFTIFDKQSLLHVCHFSFTSSKFGFGKWQLIIDEPSSIFSVLKIVYSTFFFGLIFIYLFIYLFLLLANLKVCAVHSISLNWWAPLSPFLIIASAPPSLTNLCQMIALLS